MPDRWVRSLRCKDHAGRVREFEIIVQSGEVGFRVPPGEVALFHPKVIEQLRDHITAAREEALRQRGGFD
jgi:hypothetical protein